MPKDSAGPPQCGIVIDPTPRGDVIASVILLGVAALVLAMLAHFTAPVASGGQSVRTAQAADLNGRGNSGAFARDQRAAALMSASLARPSIAGRERARPAVSSYALDANRNRVPLFFGFVEFDWDPETPGGVPGFSPTQP